MAVSDTDTTKASIIRQSLITFLLAGLIVCCIQFYLAPPGLRLFDTPEYYTESYLASHASGATMYDPQVQTRTEQKLFPYLKDEKRTVWYFHPPCAIPLLLPLSVYPPDKANMIWFLKINLAFAAALMIMQRTWGLSTKFVALAALAFSVTAPLWECVRRGQSATIMLFGLCLFIWAMNKNRPRIAGLSLSLFVLKLQLLLPIVAFLLGCRKYRAVCWLGITLSFMVAVSLLIPGAHSYVSYLELMKTAVFSSPVVLQTQLNPTLRGQMAHLFPPLFGEWIFDLTAAIMVIGWVFFFAVGRQLQTKPPQWLETGLIVVLPVGIITAMHVQNYDLIILAPVFVYLAANWKTTPPMVQAATVITTILFCIPVYGFLYEWYFLGGGVINIYFLMLLVLSACLSVHAYHRTRKTSPSPEQIDGTI